MKPASGWLVADMNPGLAHQPRPAFHPSQRRPRDAATLILLDRTGSETKILLGKRHENMAFMPGFYVFPGGKVEAADARVPAEGALPDHVARRLQVEISRPSAARARSFALAAIRELAEETGLMLGRKCESARAHAGDGDWASFQQHAVTPVLDDIWLIARSITPPGLPRRYDTRFFAAEASRICHHLEGAIHPDAELVDLRWQEIGRTHELDLHPITRLVIGELAARLSAGIERDLPVPFFRPHAGIIHRHKI